MYETGRGVPKDAVSKRSKTSTGTVISPRKRISATSMAAWAFARFCGAFPPCIMQTVCPFITHRSHSCLERVLWAVHFRG